MTGSMNFSMQMTLPFLLTAADLQSSLDILSTAYRRAGLLVNTKKTEVLSSLVTHDLPALSFSVHGDTLSNVQEFTYLGNILSDSCSRVSRNGSVICILKFIDPVI